MNTPAEMTEDELQRAHAFVDILTDGSRKLGLRPMQAKIGITATGETAIVMDLSFRG